MEPYVDGHHLYVEKLNLANENNPEVESISLMGSTLFLCFVNMRSWPLDIFKFTNIKQIRLLHSKSVEIPDEISRLVYLEKFEVSMTKIGRFPKGICQCPNMKSIDISYAEIDDIPKEIQNLKNLRIFNVRSNKIKEIPDELAECNDMTCVNISCNHIGSFPFVLCRLHNLKELYLGDPLGFQFGCDSVQMFIPKQLAQLKKLEAFGYGDSDGTMLSSLFDQMPLTLIRVPYNSTAYVTEKLAGLIELIHRHNINIYNDEENIPVMIMAQQANIDNLCQEYLDNCHINNQTDEIMICI
jgi:Leucine-rich repeat (LRR) protein